MPDPVIVLIEDEPQIRRFLRVTLTGQGYRLFEAATGADGVMEVGSRQPDVVIVDLGLPDMDGLEVIRRIREWTAVPVIVLSARGQERDKVTALGRLLIEVEPDEPAQGHVALELHHELPVAGDAEQIAADEGEEQTRSH
jgi:two-component system KDP operon response regulator KdpE